jgi:DNA-binding MarR family transcriptional regulator
MWDLLLAEARGMTRAEDDRRARLARGEGLTPGQWSVLREVGEGLPVARIARRLGLARQSVQRTADGLVERALARYAPNPDHARSPLLQATETGRARLVELERRSELPSGDELALLFETEELETALQVMRAVRDGLETR